MHKLIIFAAVIVCSTCAPQVQPTSFNLAGHYRYDGRVSDGHGCPDTIYLSAAGDYVAHCRTYMEHERSGRYTITRGGRSIVSRDFDLDIRQEGTRYRLMRDPDMDESYIWIRSER